MTSLHMNVVILACFLSAIATRTTSSPIDGSVSKGAGDDAISRDPDGVAEIVAQVIQRHLGTCQLTLVTSPSDKSPLAVAFVRRLSATFQGHMVIEAKTPLKKSLSGFEETNPTRPCLALLLVAPESSVFTETLAPFLQNSSLFLCPECRVVVTGPRNAALDTLLHPVFRNTKHALYLTPVDTATASTPVCHSATSSFGISGKGPGCATVLQGYSRCLYCWAGQAGMRTLGHWKRNVGFSENHVVFPDKLEDMNGHRIRVVAKELFPFVEHQPHSNASATTVTPKDSLDVRIYEVRMAWDDQWGTLNNGVWSGMVGTLEQERADFSLMLFWSHSRKQVIDFTRIYAYEPFVMITHKPRPLPQHTALVRPFRGSWAGLRWSLSRCLSVELWGAILAATFVLAVSLWAIQRAWSSFSGGRGMNINTAFLHAWAILLEDPPPRLPSNFTGAGEV
ncbi:Variant Ionotropic Glutamate Receptor [Penaeus vannamei]|uniref:Variant Ionotropic Glutamate Receptor n=1 Tax=Penaeus vannamei TaxID=6689 RepID=A0A3R7PF80_PENVA|nr:Variant Ionotropic Glutamate Receptor [Penaeus vannamei]